MDNFRGRRTAHRGVAGRARPQGVPRTRPGCWWNRRRSRTIRPLFPKARRSKARNDLSFLSAGQNITMHQFQARRQDFRALALDWMHGRGLSRPHRPPLFYGPKSVAVGRRLNESSKCVRKAEPLAFLQTALALDFQVFFIPVLETTESSCLSPSSVKLMPEDSQ